VIHSQTAAEYWQRRGSLVHTDVFGADLPEHPRARVFLFASSQHFASPRGRPLLGSHRNASNPLDTAPLLRALLTLLYGTGIRASECAGLSEKDINWEERTIRVLGKGGHERTVPLNEEVLHVLRQYRLARGGAKASEPFFRSREGRALSRNAIYERVRRHGRRAGIPHRVSPHQLRHTFATHLVQEGVNLVTLRDLLGHRQITSTQIYIHLTAHDLRQATDKHPVRKLIKRMEELLPDVKLPFQAGTLARFG
jgi:integrase